MNEQAPAITDAKLDELIANTVGKYTLVALKELKHRRWVERATDALPERRQHRGIARDWNGTCTDNDCWCWGSAHHNPHMGTP